MTASVLVIDEERSSREHCAETLKDLGYTAQSAESWARALSLAQSQRFDLVVADSSLADSEGRAVMTTLRQQHPGIEVVLMAGSSEIANLPQSLDARGLLTKPFKVHDLQELLQRLVESKALRGERRQIQDEAQAKPWFGRLIGSADKMQRVYHLVSMSAAKRHPVLILGESGTGKELVAREIHDQGPWRDQPFVPVDCGALTPTLIESELFGHVRGAFTGATQSRQGLLAAAGTGTAFLDEIAELPVELQSKLLRALQEKEIKPLGSNERVRLEGRIIAATNQDLEAAIKQGRFRKELYFRLNVVCIRIPPLRERKSDIPELIRHFIARYGGEGRGSIELSSEAMARLMNYDWPGNVRELENCLQRAMAMSSSPQIQIKDLPSNLLYRMTGSSAAPEWTTLQELERRAILQALEATGGDRLRAAKLLGIGKTTIYRKLKEYGIEDADDSPSR